MQISRQAKKQIAQMPSSECCMLAMLSAIIHTSATLSFSSEGQSIILPSIFLADLVGGLTDTLYGKAVQICGSKIIISGELTDMLIDLRIFKLGGALAIEEGINKSLVASDCCKKSYITGAFLACGYLALPKNGYLLEFNINSEKLCKNLSALLEYFEIKSLIMSKGEGYKLYIKSYNGVSDTLTLMGATTATLKISSLMAERDFKMQLMRQNNCDMANISKTADASALQRAAISALSSIDDPKLAEAARIRQLYPDSSYEELSKLLNVSKSTIKYRLNKLVRLYNMQNENSGGNDE